MNDFPVIFQELIKIDFLKTMFLEFKEVNSNLLTVNKANNKILENYNKLSFEINNLNYSCNKFFENFQLNFVSPNLELYENSKDFASNPYHKYKDVWLRSFKREVRFVYIENNYITSLWIRKYTDKNVLIRIFRAAKKLGEAIETKIEFEDIITYKPKKFINRASINNDEKTKEIELSNSVNSIVSEKWRAISKSHKTEIEKWTNNKNYLLNNNINYDISLIYLPQSIEEKLLAKNLRTGESKIALKGKGKRFLESYVQLQSVEQFEIIK